ncbi:MAG TPA: MBL fold metallo-hydrolase [Vicinamibacterales bacterium]|nr:MBL fold metallo-hydrolase [Vicinamibacterales bacterium]
MKIADRIHIVGSGRQGFGLTDAYDCHVYLIDGGGEYALIDAGGGRDLPGVIAQIEADGLDPAAVRQVLLTHAHADHAAGAAGLRARLGLRVLASAEVAGWVSAGDAAAASLDAARRAGVYPEDFAYPPCPADGTLADGDVVPVGDLRIEVVATPGHAAGHLAFALRPADAPQARPGIFTGDAFFHGGRILLQHTWDCSLQDSIRSVERLAALDPEGLYPGHLTFSVRGARRQLELALAHIARLAPPPQLH